MIYSRQEKKRPQASHADDWLITYADLITLLLCFFVVFLVVAAAKNNALQKVQIQQITQVVEKPSPSAKEPDVFQGILPFRAIEEIDDPDESAAKPSVADNPTPQVPANIEQKGDRIATFEESNAALFNAGSAILTDSGISILREITARLKSDMFKDYQITVEGHTDDTPIKTALFFSNWELSTARATSVVRFFLSQGIPAQRLRAAGYADTFSKVPNRDANGVSLPANQAQNRRVVIKLEKIEKSS
jgi:chemotaxis protein MotB